MSNAHTDPALSLNVMSSTIVNSALTSSRSQNDLASNSLGATLPRNPKEVYQHPNANETPKSPYNAVSHKIRKLVPEEIACKVGCGGDKCKYCGSNWPTGDMALNGVYSHWITQDILAMARPTTRAIQELDLLKQMKNNGIKSIFNLQLMDEHKYCGSKPLEKSGFSYDPNAFLENEFYYYNFGFQDYSIASMPKMIDMVKVLSFAVQQGKVAVHCHAGLGRTGLFIACYLIYSFRMSANDAIFYIRKRRNKAVQMNHQIQAIQEFEKFLTPLRVIYANSNLHFTLSTFVHRQRYFLHGYEARQLKYIPKILNVCVERLIHLIENETSDKGELMSTPKLERTRSYQEISAVLADPTVDDVQKIVSNEQKTIILEISQALTSDFISKETLKKVEHYKNLLNDKDDGFEKLHKETNSGVIVALIWSWLHHLKIPVLDEQEINILIRAMFVNDLGEQTFKWTEMDRCTFQTIDCILNIYRHLLNSDKVISPEMEFNLVRKLISMLTQTEVPISDSARVQSSLYNNNFIEEEGDIEEQAESIVADEQKKKKFLANTVFLKQQYIGIIYQAIHQLIHKPPNVKNLEYSSANLINYRPALHHQLQQQNIQTPE